MKNLECSNLDDRRSDKRRLFFLKLFLLALFFILAFAGKALSQDIIIKNDKSEIKAKVIEIQETSIKYKLFGFLDGPLRNILISDVFMIIYEDGTRETFSAVLETKPVQNQNLSINQSEVNSQQFSKRKNSQSKLGFIVGGKGGYYIPYNQTISEMYGGGFMGGLVLGYWGERSAIEIDWKYYSKEGTPYTYGSIDNATSTLTLSPLTISGYWIIPSHSNLITYIGGGLGICSINESIYASGGGQTGSAAVSLTGFEGHTTGGIKFKPFYLEVTFSSIIVEGYEDINWGGVAFGFGLFF